MSKKKVNGAKHPIVEHPLLKGGKRARPRLSDAKSEPPKPTLPKRKKPVPAWVKEAADAAERGTSRKRHKPYPRTKSIDEKVLPSEPEPTDDSMVGDGGTISTPGTTKDKKGSALFASYVPEHVQEVAQLVLHGATERDIVNHFHITRKVLRLWQMYYPEFASAMQITKAASLADQAVVRSLYELTQYREVKKQKVFISEGKPIKVKYKETLEPEMNAIKFWLMNRDPMTWGKDPEGGGGGDSKLPSQINIHMIREMPSDQLKNTIALLQSIMTPNTGLKRLDAVEAEIVPEEEPTDGGQTESVHS